MCVCVCVCLCVPFHHHHTYAAITFLEYLRTLKEQELYVLLPEIQQVCVRVHGASVRRIIDYKASPPASVQPQVVRDIQIVLLKAELADEEHPQITQFRHNIVVMQSLASHSAPFQPESDFKGRKKNVSIGVLFAFAFSLVMLTARSHALSLSLSLALSLAFSLSLSLSHAGEKGSGREGDLKDCPQNGKRRSWTRDCLINQSH